MKVAILTGTILLLAFGAQAQEPWFKTELVLTLEAVSNLNGGVDERTRTLENLDFTIEVDTANASWWEDGTFFFYFLGNHGSDPTKFVGDIQASSNIEAFDTIKLYEAWYEHRWNNFSLLAGLHDYNSEFDVLESAGIFFGSSFGISPDISQVGPSIFPTTSLAVRAFWYNEPGYFIRTAIYDGIPGDPDNQHGTHIDLKSDDGLFYALEAGRETDAYKVALGGWHRTTDFTDFSGTQRGNNGGVYLIGEHNVGEKSSIFMQVGFAQSNRNEIGSYVGVGWHTIELFAKDDEAGFGIAHARASSKNRRLNGLESAETAFELTYAYSVNDYLHIQPSLQFVDNPSMDPSIEDATIAALRVTLSY